jgi:ectoine hydroxylase-related dioxygenase (phytanoyl-CoA dioxygenase family)
LKIQSVRGDAQPVQRQEFIQAIDSQGFAIIHRILPPDIIEPLKIELESAIRAEEEYRQRNKVPSHFGMVLLCSLYGGKLVEVLGVERLMQPFEWLLGDGCIIYAYTSSSMPPHGENYSARIHVDSPRLIPGYPTNMGATILLDDFTENNGATWFVPHSHTLAEAPSDEEFYATAKRVIAPAGSVFYFNARLWHAGGRNETGRWRHALTINMCRPYMKQRIDIPRAMAYMDHLSYSQGIRQKLGFLSQVPASYDEYFAPPEKRKFVQTHE